MSRLSPRYSKSCHRPAPTPSYRHAAPAGPWPWVDDVNDQEEANNTNPDGIIGSCSHQNCNDCPQWIGYPQSLFGNWTIKPVIKCRIEEAVKQDNIQSTIYTVNVGDDGNFEAPARRIVTNENKREYWNQVLMPKRGPGIRARALFIDNMSGPVLQMLGTKYNVEPFFFSSSLNWIPSRYQENAVAKEKDHITVTLTFVRSIRQSDLEDPGNLKSKPTESTPDMLPRVYSTRLNESEHIDTRAPLVLHSNNTILHLDLLAIHMVRNADTSTVISYHPESDWCTSAEELWTRLKLVGRSVYWQLIVRGSKDPTFIFLAIMWSALYAWDEALEKLSEHFCQLESRVIVTNDMELTYELHVLRAHLLHYTSLLKDFQKSVVFVRDTHNPAMDRDEIDNETRAYDKALMAKECGNLISEIERLELNRKMLDERVQNVMHLVFANVNIGDSKAMKRLSYLTMIFLPASFVAGVFGMNVKELSQGTTGTLAHYIAATLPLTIVTIWLVVAFQSRYILSDPKASMWVRLLWPIAFLKSLAGRHKKGPLEECQAEKGSPGDIENLASASDVSSQATLVPRPRLKRTMTYVGP
ncbi:hypothetical protein BOTBODRAFT_190632 [Botryobasidium botryosum FD-172 SS1]|uniref:Uncharacterized protein n=1 Tax=Botryobasidium botryosum (strain FD-172 SS1) TaxID=930990 RepID=A0A067ME27_BOTB1|nr:hypothetical protein BOTBODRAFT_190632 [Botryobasidium botryosum FD-172 SS1]